MLKQVHVQLYPPKGPHSHGDIKKHCVPLVSSLLTLTRFDTSSWYFIVEFGEVLPAAFTSREQSTDK